MATYGTPSIPATYSVSYNNLHDMMEHLADNTDNNITAKDVRDTALTLWDRSDQIEIQIGTLSQNALYTNPNPTTIDLGGIPLGTTFSNQTLTDMFNFLLYPYTAPQPSLSGGDNREFGSANMVVLNWSVTVGKNALTSIVVDGTNITPSGGNQSGSKVSSATQNVNTTFQMSVNDGVSVYTANTTVTWMNKIYWGSYATFSVPSSSDILALNGAGAGTGNELTDSFYQYRENMNGNGNYLMFAWPTSFGTPTFVVNGIINTAFTKIGNAISFTNTWGYTTTYDAWITNTQQNAPIAYIQIYQSQ